jgi:hypothetical protein
MPRSSQVTRGIYLSIITNSNLGQRLFQVRMALDRNIIIGEVFQS